MMSKLIFRQLFDRVSCTYTYLLGDLVHRSAIIIDPVIELAERDFNLIRELGLRLFYAVNTHVHADHVTGSGKLREMFKNVDQEPNVQTIISRSSEAKADGHVDEGDTIHCSDDLNLVVVLTPGHTNGCMSLIDHKNKRVFTGDTLLIRGCGRTDFQSGSSELLYESIHKKLFTLPEDYTVYPAHDYKGQTASSIREEKLFNPRLTKSKLEFIKIMENLNLDKPKLIDMAVPKNFMCGI